MRPIVDEGVRVVGVAVGTYRRLGDFTAKDGGGRKEEDEQERR